MRISGNAEADNIARNAIHAMTPPYDYKHHYIDMPKNITKLSSVLTYTIDSKIYKALREAKASQNAGPSSDDISSSDAQQISLRSATS